MHANHKISVLFACIYVFFLLHAWFSIWAWDLLQICHLQLPIHLLIPSKHIYIDMRTTTLCRAMCFLHSGCRIMQVNKGPEEDDQTICQPHRRPRVYVACMQFCVLPRLQTNAWRVYKKVQLPALQILRFNYSPCTFSTVPCWSSIPSLNSWSSWADRCVDISMRIELDRKEDHEYILQGQNSGPLNTFVGPDRAQCLSRISIGTSSPCLWQCTHARRLDLW
jgi:hypothetical protein